MSSYREELARLEAAALADEKRLLGEFSEFEPKTRQNKIAQARQEMIGSHGVLIKGFLERVESERKRLTGKVAELRYPLRAKNTLWQERMESAIDVNTAYAMPPYSVAAFKWALDNGKIDLASAYVDRMGILEPTGVKEQAAQRAIAYEAERWQRESGIAELQEQVADLDKVHKFGRVLLKRVNFNFQINMPPMDSQSYTVWVDELKGA